MKWLILALGVLSNTAASVLIKVAVDGIDKTLIVQKPWLLLGNLSLVIGVGLYGAAFVLYALALTRLPLNVAHPILTCGAVALVALSSYLIFKESFTVSMFVGFLLIMSGVWLIAQRG